MQPPTTPAPGVTVATVELCGMDIAYYAYTKTGQPLPGGAGRVGTEENVIQLAKSPSGQWQVTGMSGDGVELPRGPHSLRA
ncbi:MAG: hypothetical protein M0000_13840 [Actinomycetota bacterium]|nr:hypothetical protein [Actinomycetota bacterium]